MKFHAVVELHGKTATGIEVPADVFTALNGGKRAAVVVTIGGHSYRSTVSPYKGQILLPLSAENRAAAGVSTGDEVEVELVLDEAPRTVTVPPDLAEALAKEPAAKQAFDALAFTHQKEHVRAIEDAKKPETRLRRLEKTMDLLRG
jgi:hypothetical protein